MSECQCDQAGFCPVYQREMTPKEFECCHLVGEIGEKHRNNWLREAGLFQICEKTDPVEVTKTKTETKTKTARKASQTPQEPPAPAGVKKVLLVNNLCAGDVLVSTAAIESLASQNRDRFWVGVDARDNQAVYENNPHLHKLDRKDPQVRVVDWDYPEIGSCNQRPIHFMEAYTSSLSAALGMPLVTSVNRPYVYLTDEEKTWTNQVQEFTGKPTKFWLLNAGFKNCFTTKGWLPESYQAVVDHFRGSITFVQIGQSWHNHKKLDGVIDFIDKTDLRQLIRLGWHCEGAIGPSTFLQHLMAAFEKPYVLVDSAREPASWMAYPNQTSLIRHGMLTCASAGSCWKTRTVALKDGKDGSLCEQPVYGGSIPIPRCSAMISPGDVIRAVEGYYRGGRCSH